MAVGLENPKSVPDISLVMVGRDKHDGSLEETKRVAAELGVADRLQLPGGVPKEDVANWLNEGDIFLNTTHVDNAPVSVLEAMACGLCVVSTAAGGMADLAEDGREALLVRPDDPMFQHEADVYNIMGSDQTFVNANGNDREK